MKNLILEAHKNMPEFLPAEALNQLRSQFSKVHVTEALDTEQVDILVDKRDQSVKVRVDGKGRGADWKLWKDHFEVDTGSSYLLRTCPIDTCIIRCSTSRSPRFLKVLGVLSVDPVTAKQRWIPFQMVKKFCDSCNMSPMPVTYSGMMSFEQIKGLVDKPILGVQRAGIFVVPEMTPTQYIKIPVNVDTAVFTPEASYDEKVLQSLALEFAVRCFGEEELKAQAEAKGNTQKFVQSVLRKASESLLLAEYTQRVQQEAGADAEKAGIDLKQAVVERAENLWRKYA